MVSYLTHLFGTETKNQRVTEDSTKPINYAPNESKNERWLCQSFAALWAARLSFAHITLSALAAGAPDATPRRKNLFSLSLFPSLVWWGFLSVAYVMVIFEQITLYSVHYSNPVHYHFPLQHHDLSPSVLGIKTRWEQFLSNQNDLDSPRLDIQNKYFYT